MDAGAQLHFHLALGRAVQLEAHPRPHVGSCGLLPNPHRYPRAVQVVALYGYLDDVDLGEAFLSELLGAVQRRLLAAGRSTGARLGPDGAPLRGGAGGGAGAASPANGAGRSSGSSGKSSVKSVSAVSGVSLAASSAGGGLPGSTQGSRVGQGHLQPLQPLQPQEPQGVEGRAQAAAHVAQWEIQPAGGSVGSASGVRAAAPGFGGGRVQRMRGRGERRGGDRGGEDGGYSTADDRRDMGVEEEEEDDDDEEEEDGDDVQRGRQRDTAARPSAAASSLGTEAPAQTEAVRALVESTIAEFLEAQLHGEGAAAGVCILVCTVQWRCPVGRGLLGCIVLPQCPCPARSAVSRLASGLRPHASCHAHAGVVYYASRPLLRSPATLLTGFSTAAAPVAGAAVGAGADAKRSRAGAAPGLLRRMWRWAVYGHLYRWLAMLSWYDMEQWQVPYDRLVELGMSVDLS